MAEAANQAGLFKAAAAARTPHIGTFAAPKPAIRGPRRERSGRAGAESIAGHTFGNEMDGRHRLFRRIVPW